METSAPTIKFNSSDIKLIERFQELKLTNDSWTLEHESTNHMEITKTDNNKYLVEVFSLDGSNSRSVAFEKLKDAISCLLFAITVRESIASAVRELHRSIQERFC